MLRITRLRQDTQATTLKLEGRIAAAWASEPDAQCRRQLAAGRRVRPDCDQLSALDARGLLLLKTLCGQNVEIVNCPALIRELPDGLAEQPG